jgi:tRNA pseudouridine13 synthase
MTTRPAPVSLPDWPRTFGPPRASAVLRACPEDFIVDEQLGFLPDGEGEHVMLWLQKRNRNTEEVARQLARHAGVRARDVSYCGLKDRNAITRQWFSVWLPGREAPDWSALEDESLRILLSERHRRKLQRGALEGNGFEILLRDVHGEREELEHRLHGIAQRGVPNYFGEQRFGRDGANLAKAAAMFQGQRVKDRHLRGLYLSAARAFLFNEVLAVRVQDGSWQQVLPGEAVMLAGSHSFFVCETPDAVIAQRLQLWDIHPSGPLWGKGALPTRNAAQELEQWALASHEVLTKGLEQAGLKQERRALRLPVAKLKWDWEGEAPHLRLRFQLPAGGYATAVLRELVSPRV